MTGAGNGTLLAITIIRSSLEMQKGSTTSHFNTQLDRSFYPSDDEMLTATKVLGNDISHCATAASKTFNMTSSSLVA